MRWHGKNFGENVEDQLKRQSADGWLEESLG
jgi:hypothetical protein